MQSLSFLLKIHKIICNFMKFQKATFTKFRVKKVT